MSQKTISRYCPFKGWGGGSWKKRWDLKQFDKLITIYLTLTSPITFSIAPSPSPYTSPPPTIISTNFICIPFCDIKIPTLSHCKQSTHRKAHQDDRLPLLAVTRVFTDSGENRRWRDWREQRLKRTEAGENRGGREQRRERTDQEKRERKDREKRNKDTPQRKIKLQKNLKKGCPHDVLE